MQSRERHGLSNNRQFDSFIRITTTNHKLRINDLLWYNSTRDQWFSSQRAILLKTFKYHDAINKREPYVRKINFRKKWTERENSWQKTLRFFANFSLGVILIKNIISTHKFTLNAILHSPVQSVLWRLANVLENSSWTWLWVKVTGNTPRKIPSLTF